LNIRRGRPAFFFSDFSHQLNIVRNHVSLIRHFPVFRSCIRLLIHTSRDGSFNISFLIFNDDNLSILEFLHRKCRLSPAFVIIDSFILNSTRPFKSMTRKKNNFFPLLISRKKNCITCQNVLKNVLSKKKFWHDLLKKGL